MHAVGIICEYNPFHNGHLYHLNKVKEMFPNQPIIVILGGNFLQRGEPSIINKWDKTKIALHYGADLVIELPYPFASQSADLFAKGSIQLLNHLHVNDLVFGSESNKIDNLKMMADIQLNNPSYQKLVKEYITKGVNYPTALSKALGDITGKVIDTPNDILGISYIREIMALKSKINPHTIQRTNDYHSLELDNDIVSATSIRNALKNKQVITKYVPKETYQSLQSNLHFIDDYYPFLKYKILSDLNNLIKYQTVDEGIENRIKKYIIKSNSLDQLIMNIKTKRYTYNKIRRMLTHIMCNFTKEEASKMKEIEYIRVLGLSDLGQTYLKSIKKEISIPILTNYIKDNAMLDLELRVTSIYASILKEQDKTKMIEGEYKNKPIRK